MVMYYNFYLTVPQTLLILVVYCFRLVCRLNHSMYRILQMLLIRDICCLVVFVEENEVLTFPDHSIQEQ